MDIIDTKLIRLLADDAKQSSEKLARKLHLSAATVRRRLRRLLSSGTVRILAISDPIKSGFPITAVIAFDVSHTGLDSALRELAAEPNILWAATTTGRFDIIALARFQTTEHLSDFVEKRVAKIEGVVGSETFVCLRRIPTRNIGL